MQSISSLTIIRAKSFRKSKDGEKIEEEMLIKALPRTLLQISSKINLNFHVIL